MGASEGGCSSCLVSALHGFDCKAGREFGLGGRSLPFRSLPPPPVVLVTAGNSAGCCFNFRLSALRGLHQGNNVDQTTASRCPRHAARTVTQTTTVTIFFIMLLLRMLSTLALSGYRYLLCSSIVTMMAIMTIGMMLDCDFILVTAGLSSSRHQALLHNNPLIPSSAIETL